MQKNRQTEIAERKIKIEGKTDNIEGDGDSDLSCQGKALKSQNTTCPPVEHLKAA